MLAIETETSSFHEHLDLEVLIAVGHGQEELSRWLQPLFQEGRLAPEQRVILCMDNTQQHVDLLLHLLSRSISPLLVSNDTTAAELDSLAREIDAKGILRYDQSGLSFNAVQGVVAVDQQANQKPLGIFLITSGSTGKPSVVFRPMASWRHEGVRYLRLLGLSPSHAVLIAAPLHHAYALGWLWAALMARSELDLARPTQLAAIVTALRSRCTHCALTPTLASLIARRAAEGGRPPKLQVVMAGAGPVDAALDEMFAKSFGLRLSRNYGSTESGALMAGIAPLPPNSIGLPMPMLHVLPEGVPEGAPFALSVRLENGDVYDTGDLVKLHQGSYRILGRETSSIRRGERWISTFEIEGVILEHGDVAECQVRAVKTVQPGNDHVFASIRLKPGRTWNEEDVRRHCGERLSRNKVPDRFELVDALPRSKNGKPLPSPVYRPADPQILIKAAHAFKQSHMLFALFQSGVLDLLGVKLSVDQIADRTGLHADTLGHFLNVAALMGLVSPAEAVLDGARPSSSHASIERDSSLSDCLALECLTSQTVNGLPDLAAMLKRGRLAPSPAGSPDQQLAKLYQQAMGGTHKHLSSQLAIRRLLRRQQTPLAVLDITATGGTYIRKLAADKKINLNASKVAHVGRMAPPADAPCPALASLDPQELNRHAQAFDVLVLDNAVHHASVADVLPLLLECLTPGGTIVVDEIFLEPGERASVGLDWLTHGGLQFITEPSFKSAMSSHGFNATEVHRGASVVCHIAALYSAETSAETCHDHHN